MTSFLNFLLAAACAAVVANIYYAQPLVGLIAETLNLPRAAAGLIVTLTQIGYGLGVLLLVPLGDLVENRKLILTSIGVVIGALLAAALARDHSEFLAAALAVGFCSSAVQIMIPYAASLSSDAHRGRVVGNCTSGVMIGIMLARPLASFVTNSFGWRAVFLSSSAFMALVLMILSMKLPKRVPSSLNKGYVAILASMGRLFVATPILRRRGAYQACQFGAFSLFWTTTPLVLAREFHLSQLGIAFFALAGVAGAVSAPVAGRLADRGLTRPLTGIGIACVGAAFLLTRIFTLPCFVAAGILLDAGVTALLVLGQRAIFSLGEESRSRLNGMFIAMIFVGGAIGSALGTWAYSQGGWAASSLVGLSLPCLALSIYLTEFRRPQL